MPTPNQISFRFSHYLCQYCFRHRIIANQTIIRFSGGHVGLPGVQIHLKGVGSFFMSMTLRRREECPTDACERTVRSHTLGQRKVVLVLVLPLALDWRTPVATKDRKSELASAFHSMRIAGGRCLLDVVPRPISLLIWMSSIIIYISILLHITRHLASLPPFFPT
ncbi:hypothetical protein DFS33DRAFT_824794 [Desarmillaria ectypa]|nr:hypothetical protein DFS33DRAFT_824794 [Desarmillaria ectypa]